jgi:chromate transporter
MPAPVDLLALFTHFLLLSLLAIGGHHRRPGYASRTGRTNGIAHRRAIQFVHRDCAGLSWAQRAVRRRNGYQGAGLAGAAATLAGIMLPSTTLALAAARSRVMPGAIGVGYRRSKQEWLRS